MRGIIDVIIGLVFVVGGLSGKLAFRGTNSGGLLAVVGGGLIAFGIYKMSQSSRGAEAQLPPQNDGHAPSWDQAPAANPAPQKSAENDVLKPPTGS